MKSIFKRNQIIITALAIMIAIAGYLNYADTDMLKNKESAAVSQNKVGETSKTESKEKESVPGEAVLANGDIVNNIASVKLNREQVRAENREALSEIINNESLGNEQKQEAVDAMVALTDASEKEAAAENMLAAKGFSDAVVSMNDGKVDVVVGLSEISDEQRAQIEDIVKRKTEVGVENISIMLME